MNLFRIHNETAIVLRSHYLSESWIWYYPVGYFEQYNFVSSLDHIVSSINDLI